MKYRKISPRIWKDEHFRALDFRDKLIALYVITAQSNRIGIFNFSPAQAGEDLELSSEDFHKRFINVCQMLNWQWDLVNRVIYLPTWWKYNPPENPNVLAGSLKDLSELPATPLLDSFFENVAHLPYHCQGLLRKPSGNVISEPQERSPNQEQYQEQEQEQYQEQKQEQKQEQDKSASRQPPGGEASGNSRVSAKEFTAAWNATCFRKIRKFTAARAKHLRARAKDSDWATNWRAALAKLTKIPGACGKNRDGWVADADFFLRPDTVNKILEGKYDTWGEKSGLPPNRGGGDANRGGDDYDNRRPGWSK